MSTAKPTPRSLAYLGFLQFILGILIVPFLLAASLGLLVGGGLQLFTGNANLPAEALRQYNSWPEVLTTTIELLISLVVTGFSAYAAVNFLKTRYKLPKHGSPAGLARVASFWAIGYSLLGTVVLFAVYPLATTGRPLSLADDSLLLAVSVISQTVAVAVFYLASRWSWQRLTPKA